MSLDISTLYLVAAMVAAMLGAMLLLFGKQEKIPALQWWAAGYLLGAASVALWTIAGVLKLAPENIGALLGAAQVSIELAGGSDPDQYQIGVDHLSDALHDLVAADDAGAC